MHSVYIKIQLLLFLVTKLCPAVCNPMNCSLPDTFVHGISQARLLKWVAISDSRGSCQPRDGEGSVFFFFLKKG